MPKRVIILCTGNSCRSQMAEGLWRELAGGAWEPHSAGTEPAGHVHPLAVRAMHEIDIDITDHESKHVDALSGVPFDLAVTVCDDATETCPVLPNARETVHWPFEDPALARGTEDEMIARFRSVRDRMRACIERYLSSRH